MDGFVWSLMSAEAGGFLDAVHVADVKTLSNGVMCGTVIRNFNGDYKEDTHYEFFPEQFVPLSTDVWNVDVPSTVNQTFYRGDKVKVYARQCWKQILDTPINGTVYQHQINGGSVVVSVNPDHFDSPCINSVGGTTIEVYPQQLRLFRHNERHPILGSPDAVYVGTNEGFQRAKQFRKKKPKFSWFRNIFS